MIEMEVAAESLRELAHLRQLHRDAALTMRRDGDAVNRAVAFVATEFGGLWEAAAPRQTGTLAFATRETIFNGQGQVFIDPTVENPVTGGFPSEYGPAVHGRKPWVAQVFMAHAERLAIEAGTQLFDDLDDIYR